MTIGPVSAYVILESTTPDGLSNQVTDRIRVGWQPLGAPIWVAGPNREYIIQAMVKTAPCGGGGGR